MAKGDRLYYKAHWEDLDGDGIEDFAIRNKYNKLVGVNGYTTRKGHFLLLEHNKINFRRENSGSYSKFLKNNLKKAKGL